MTNERIPGIRKGFLGISAGLIGFCVLTNFLIEAVEEVPDWGGVVCHMGYLILSAGSVFLLFGCLFRLRRYRKPYTALTAVLMVFLLGWNLFLGTVILRDFYEEEKVYSLDGVDGTAEQLTRAAFLRQLHEKSQLFGRGENWNVYPEPATLDRPADDENAIQEYNRLLQLSQAEQQRNGILFDDWRSISVLPVLSLAYGSWFAFGYCAVVLLWLICAVAGWRRVLGIGEKTLYGSCLFLLAVLLLGPVLDNGGLVYYSLGFPFLDSDWLSLTAIGMLQLGSMAVLQCASVVPVFSEIPNEKD